MFQTIDKQLKIVIVGNSCVGKSSLLWRFVDNKFTQQLLSTIGVDFKFRTLNIGGKKVKLQIWDTAGQENFRAIISAYYNGADGIVIVYDLTSWESFQDLKTFWIKQAKQHKQQKTSIMLIGCKSDLVQKRQVIKQTVEDFAKQENISLSFETSSKSSVGVQQAFIAFAEELLLIDDSNNQNKIQNKRKLNQPMTPKSNSKCCFK